MSKVDVSTSLSQSYGSFSGVDIKATINGKECGSIQHLSYMIQRERASNYMMRPVDPISLSRGRGINGVIRGFTSPFGAGIQLDAGSLAEDKEIDAADDLIDDDLALFDTNV